MPLTNTVKELEENLDFGIQKLIKSEPGINPDRKMRQRWFVGDADELLDEVVGSVQQRKRKQWFSQELEQSNKRKPF